MYQNLIGAWQLTSFTLEKDGIQTLWRKDVTGLLIYTEDGAMSVAMNSRLEPGDDLFDSVLFYSGTWSTSAGQVHHHVENATEIKNIGQTLSRYVKFYGEELELSASGDYGRASVTWTKRHGRSPRNRS